MPTPTPTSASTASRSESIDSIQRELTAVARRARSVTAQIHPGLTLVTYTLLDHLHERGGCRGTDLAAHFLLDKSTVSRQISALEKLGLVERTADPEDLRGQIIRPSAAGEQLLADVRERRHQAFLNRLADWPDDDLERFASYLALYNART